MSNALNKIQRDLHRCNASLRKSAKSNRKRFNADRNRKHWTRFELRDAAQHIRRMA